MAQTRCQILVTHNQTHNARRPATVPLRTAAAQPTGLRRVCPNSVLTARGTGSSNLLSSSGESTNFRFLSRRRPLFDRMISLPSKGPLGRKGSDRQSAASDVRRSGRPRRKSRDDNGVSAVSIGRRSGRRRVKSRCRRFSSSPILMSRSTRASRYPVSPQRARPSAHVRDDSCS